ncbi:MAG: hypothetical protein KC684_09795, partial [Candidatus Omnitrophica bacterium]|nr:hypothetical protein [Candidatus Omnitrophota bacterium]
MPNIRMEPIIRKSISRTKLILLETLDWKKWLKLLFIAWLAGALGGGGKGGDLSDFARLINKQQAGNNAELPQASSATYNYSAQQDTSVPAEPASEYDEQYSMEYDRDYQDSEGSSDAESVLESWQEEESPYGTEETKESDQYEEYGFKEAGSRGSPGMFIWVFIGLFTLAILIPFSWLVSRFKFIWYNAVVKNDAAIAEPFKRYHRQGNSFFVFAWIYTIILVSFWGG